MISRKARLWTGLTILIVLAFNYLMIGYPLFKRAGSIRERSRAILMRQVKAGDLLKGSEEEYMLDILRREKAKVDKKIVLLNALGMTLFIGAMSWTAYGLVMRRRSR